VSPLRQPWVRGIATFAIGLVLSGVAAIALERSNRSSAQARIDELGAQTVAAQIQRLHQYELGLLGARGAVLAAGADRIDRDGFSAYSASRNYAKEFPGARGFGLIRRVTPESESAFVEKARRDGWPSFAVRQLNPHSGERFVIQYIEPVERNRAAVGLDIASESNRRNAALLAMRTGDPTLTGLITLVQAIGKPQQSFLLLLPIYRPGMPLATEAERELACIGWSYAPLVMDEVLSGLKLSGGELTLKLTDMGEPIPTTFFESGGIALTGGSYALHGADFSIFGRHWKAEVSPTKLFYENLNQTRPTVLASELAGLSGLLGVLVYLLASVQARSREVHLAQAHRAAIVETSLDAIIVQSLHGEVIDWNPGAEKMFGFGADEAVGKPLAMLLLPVERRSEDAQILGSLSAGGFLPPFETTRVCKDGHLVHVSMAVSALTNRSGELVGITKVIRDISEAKRAEAMLVDVNAQLERLVQDRTQTLNETLHDFRTILDALPSMIGYWDKNLVNKVANKAYADWLGIDHKLIPGQHMEALLGQELYQLNRPYVSEVLEGKAQTFERRIPAAGDLGYRHALAYYLPDVVDGEVKGFYVLVHDLTELTESRMQLAAAQRSSQALLQTIHQHAIVSVADRAGVILEVNDSFCNISGFTREELIGENHRLINSGLHGAEFWDGMWATISAGNSWRADVCNKARDGSIYWVDSIIAPILGSSGEIERFISIRTDITERKRLQADVVDAHQQLEESERFLRNITDHLPVRISYTDRDSKVQFANATYCDYLGLAREEIIGKTRAELFAESDLSSALPVFEAVSQGVTQRIEHDEVVDGKLLSVDTHLVPDVGGDGLVKGLYMVSADITERRKAERDLRQTMTLLNSVLAAASQVSIIAVKPDGLISVFNAGAERLLGYTQNEVVGRMSSLEFHRETELRERALAVSEEQGRKVHTGQVLIDPSELNGSREWTYLRKDGVGVPVSLGITAMRDDIGDLVGYLGIAHDVSEQKEHERSLRDAVHKARRANEAKTQFLANMSHEIRTPMNAVIGLSYLLERTPLDSEQTGLLGKIKLASRSLLALINDILDLSKIEASELKIESAPFCPGSLLRELRELVSVQSDAKGIDFRLSLPSDLPLMVEGDATRLNQILLNLLTNAVKFTPSGSVRLDVSRVGGSAEVSRLRFTVRDTGIGMTEAQMNRLFTPFAQADASTTRCFGGTGLGLSIVKQLVQLMGGEIGVESHPARGSEFWVEIDFRLSAEMPLPERLEHHASPTGAALRGVRVLVADDSDINLEVAQRVLELEGAQVSLAHNGQEAVDHLLANPEGFDLVLLDLQMPVLDGFDACRRIRSGLGLQRLPIIALSASTLSSEMELAKRAGMNDFMSKPFDAAQLVARIRRWVPLNEASLSGPVVEPRRAPPAAMWAEVEGIDMEEARQRLGGDYGLFCSMLKRLIGEFGSIGQTTSGSEPEDLPALGSRLHKLRGSAGTLGAKGLAHAASQVEKACRMEQTDQVRALLAVVEEEMKQLIQASALALQGHADQQSGEPDEPQGAMAEISDTDLAKLTEAFLQSDLDALDLLTSLAPGLRRLLGVEVFAQLQEQADNLDFDGAATTLRELQPA
jgi:PAS domain S-box-containing protein